MNTNQLLYQIALTQTKGVGDVIARYLLDHFGSAQNIFEAEKKSLNAIKGLPKNVIDELLNPDTLKRAEAELEFVSKNKIQTYFIEDENYPTRLKECIDAPILFYLKGNVNLDSAKIISIVGTRKSTHYGESFCENFIEELANIFPDTLIISGLAYGIDICAHRASLKNGLPTLAVLAHGLNRIYPSAHRKTAIEMLEHGGLLTEFPSKTEPDKFNFVRRNRIVAGLADTTIVIESDVKGGSLITTDIAASYNRDVLALPGRVTDPQSKGCNKLIQQNKAAILRSVDDLIELMNWDQTIRTKKPQQRDLFLNLSEKEQLIYDILLKTDGLHVNAIANETDISVSQLFSTLLELEMRGIIKPLPGSIYTLN